MYNDQSNNEITFFINENNKFVLNILKNVLGIPFDSVYTMESDCDDSVSSFFTIYDEHKTSSTPFSVEYDTDLKEFHLFIEHVIYPFESYDFHEYRYSCNVILDSELNYLRTEIAFQSANDQTDMLIFMEDGNGISVSYLSPPTFFEGFVLTSKNFMTDSFNDEAIFLTELYSSHPSIFMTYSIADLFNARTDTILLNDMKQISDMATI